MLERFDYADMTGRAIALQAATHDRTLRSNGVTTRGTIDLLVGSFCIAHGHALLYSDREFDPMRTHLGLVAA